MQGTPEEQRAVVQQFKDTSHVFGFFRIRCGNVLGPEEVADTHRVFSEFFGMEEEKKAAVSKGAIKKANDSFTSTGYRPGTGGINNKGRESYSCSVPYYKPGDPLYSDTYYTSDEGKKYFAVAPDPQVVWPAKELIPNFQDQVTQYYKKVEMIGKLLFRIFALVLDVEEERFLPMADKHISSMNAFHFTGKTCNDILEAHADITCFTIISYDHSPGAEGSQCLEILTPDKLWVPVKSMPGTFLLNIGQIMERWSNGRLKATLHRVIQPKFLPPGSRRQCIVFFQSTNYNTVLDVLPEFAPADPTTSKYSPERMDQYSLTRLSLFYKEGVSDEEAWYNYNKDVMDKQDYYTLKYI
uniref:Isopenicillin N synthase-like Fe(2+) 2OG dioxygenase domain-containing protein n=1 Tax=Arcella intermedia TaxID=1963864 RepID=A0A6B2L808_9EUKA